MKMWIYNTQILSCPWLLKVLTQSVYIRISINEKRLTAFYHAHVQ